MSSPDPIARFAQTYARVLAALPEILNPTAMVVSSVSAEGRPSSRFVLLKDFDARGFVFYTNLHSRKGRELAANPWASLCFYWAQLDEQVRIEGKVEPVSDAEADAYFATRPRVSQIGAWASDQSAPLESYELLMARVVEVSARFGNGPVSRPPHWSGLRVVPDRIEFWHSRPDRLHDRQLFVKQKDGWTLERLYP